MTDTSAPVYRERDFHVFLLSRFLATSAMQVLSVAVGWQIYAIARDPLALGLVGLSQFVPMFLFTLPAGDVADRADQRLIYALSLGVAALCGALLLALSLSHPTVTWPFYAILALFGAARGFTGPAGSALLAFLVPMERLPKAIGWNSTAFQTAVIAGPAIGGFLYALGPVAAYAVCAACFLGAALGVTTLGGRRRMVESAGGTTALGRVGEGIRFVRTRPVVLGALSLDLFAVLLGGAVALLPAFARDILHVGPEGLGLLRSAPAAGAALMAVAFGRRPLERHAGPLMFAAVALFGVATIVFGLSTSFLLSLGALFVLGASDMVSVFIRTSLIQIATPDAMRGRVSAVNMLFIGASNELGEFESGLTASWWGTVPAVIVGGLGTLLVVALWMWGFPPLRKIDRLTDVMPGETNS
ncbi:MAG: MFS transporter [Alphaproteobacteria bacterium]|nr:MFS transporter [Alphaproteobacteria bacterium]MBU6471476.1 MFS transporter [Alphaproteobacteria bacterium]MDE2012140.1 MFS transporter [Alphaproteobacteria bacterium]MDE2072153.1 MFS transporter [Alphaproteobacteria bacterium]MDE2353151.1 MFS transporter [Alphaproteobacteria bacterium]